MGTFEEDERSSLLFMVGIKKNQDFARVYRKGRSSADRYLVVYLLDRNCDEIAERRFGVSVSKKVGNSVVRHRIKRRLKEIFRLNEMNCPSGKDYIVIARKPAADADYALLEESFLKLVLKTNKRS